jgi:hypothetical protein
MDRYAMLLQRAAEKKIVVFGLKGAKEAGSAEVARGNKVSKQRLLDADFKLRIRLVLVALRTRVRKEESQRPQS